ncbi:site-2 protease family protein [Caldimonas tepidiphila]|uniref:site-2 protease family protein n=1 Tax=Caldimonas tepidiphila TaxID=2315841 RepID=UPI000E5BAC51|nr:site-2 protease family protein [Caldimonas tepidiphila]
MDSEIIRTVLVYALPVLFAITVHEAAHGYAARHFGDPTAEMLGRITLNPARHIDPFGTVAMPLLLYVASAGLFTFGYAKPVPVDYRRLRHPKHDMVWVAFAGPASNLAQAIAWALLGAALLALDVEEDFFLQMARAGMLVNGVMFALNLFPLPPLDGGRMLIGALPLRAAAALARLERFGFLVVIALLVAGLLTTYWMLPILRALLGALTAALPSLQVILSLS